MFYKIVTILTLLFVNASVFACGTPQDWLDAIEGSSKNEWMSSMNQRESLVMIKGCGHRQFLNRTDQLRMGKFLAGAIKNKMLIGNMPINHSELRREVSPFSDRYAVEALIMATYLRFNCLGDVHSPDFVNDVLSRNVCNPTRELTVKAKGGAYLRYSPGGEKLASVKDGVTLRLIDQVNDWYRIINPKSNSHSAQKILYIHKSVVNENL